MESKELDTSHYIYIEGRDKVTLNYLVVHKPWQHGYDAVHPTTASSQFVNCGIMNLNNVNILLRCYNLHKYHENVA